eukprot:COSAG01_NODE_641_length_14573_cov_17.634637_6_plen_177_part_00
MRSWSPETPPLVPFFAFRQLKQAHSRHQSTATPPHQRRPHQLATAARSRPRWSPTSLCPPECRCTSGSAGPTARAGSEPRRRVGSRLPQLPNRWLGIGAEGPRHPSCRLPRGDGRVGGALSGGRGPYPHLTTRGGAGPSLLRGAFCGRGGGWRPQLLFWVQSTVQRMRPVSGLPLY